MPKIATSLKLPENLKTRVEAAAEAAGKTPHAFMVDAIERETSRAELYETFVQRISSAYASFTGRKQLTSLLCRSRKYSRPRTSCTIVP